MDGWITIGTKIVDKLDEGLKKIKKKLDNFDKENEAKIVVSTDESKIKIQEVADEIQNMVKDYNALMNQDILSDSDLRYAKQFRTEIEEAIKEYEKLSGEKLHIKSLEKASNDTKKINSSMSDILKKVTKWGLAIFGIRSVYSFIRSSISTISQYNEQLATDVEYIKYALANSLEPVIKRIIGLVQTLLTYINYIAKAWFGINLFASAKSFEDMKKSAAGTAKSAKEINKQLAGFDEMNILSDSSSSSSGGGSISAPSFDLANWEDIEIPAWIQWIADNKDTVLGFLTAFGLALAGIKIVDFIDNLGLLGEGFSNLDKVVMGLGIGLVIYGIYETVKAIMDFINDPSWENFANILKGLAIILTGISLILIAINLTNPFGWIMLAVAGVVALVAVIIEHWDKIKEVLGTVGTWIYNHIIEPVVDFFSGLWDTLVEIFTSLWETIKEIFSPVIEFFASIFGTVWENIKITIDNLLQIFNALWEAIKYIFTPVIDLFKDIFNQVWNTVKNFISTMTNLFKDGWNAIKNVFSPFVEFFSGLFSKVGTKLKEWGGTVGDIIGGAFKGAVNGVLKAIESILNTPIKAINGLISVINAIPGIKLTKLSTFSLPRLAKGGIINMPGKGVPIGYGSAIGGEAGAEWVQPLTDSQSLDRVAEAIGGRITVPVTTIVKLDGRQIARYNSENIERSRFARNS